MTAEKNDGKKEDKLVVRLKELADDLKTLRSEVERDHAETTKSNQLIRERMALEFARSAQQIGSLLARLFIVEQEVRTLSRQVVVIPEPLGIGSAPRHIAGAVCGVGR